MSFVYDLKWSQGNLLDHLFIVLLQVLFIFPEILRDQQTILIFAHTLVHRIEHFFILLREVQSPSIIDRVDIREEASAILCRCGNNFNLFDNRLAADLLLTRINRTLLGSRSTTSFAGALNRWFIVVVFQVD